MLNLWKLGLLVGTGLLTVALAAPSFADGKNWDADKQDQVDKNRGTNAGVGNGGENMGGRTPNKNGEDGRGDDDPGNSQDHNQAGDNDGNPQSEAADGGTWDG